MKSLMFIYYMILINTIQLYYQLYFLYFIMIPKYILKKYQNYNLQIKAAINHVS